jgi:hypothetical protein
MLRWIPRALCLFSLMLVASLAIAQAEFSADIVDLQKSGAQTKAKVYFTKDKMRVEPSANSAHSGGAMIVNFATQTSIVLMAQQHMYMEMPANAQMQRQGYLLFQTGDIEAACTDWQKTGHNQGGTCRKVGNDSVNGRSTVEFEATNANGDVNHFWIDPKLRFPVKWDGKNNSGELRNISEGSQPASLFEVPAGFTKMQLPGGMQMPQR